jgi:molybdopterin adenylyltransferase
MPKAAVLTISDRSYAGTQEDVSGAITVELLRERLGLAEVHAEVVPDDQALIEQTLRRWIDDEGYELVVTSGGTGLSPRDVTPQATLNVAAYQVPGLAEVMRAASLQKTSMAALSRAVAVVRGRSLIVNLPGSPKGVRECLESILPVLPHALEQLASGGGHPL